MLIASFHLPCGDRSAPIRPCRVRLWSRFRCIRRRESLDSLTYRSWLAGGHDRGCERVRRRVPVADLTRAVVSPCEQCAVMLQRQGMRTARRDRDDACAGPEPDHLPGRGAFVVLAVSELARGAVPPRPHRTVGL